MNDCPSQKILAEFFDGHLDGPELTAIADHLESCTWCQGTIRNLKPVDTVVESLRGKATAIEESAIHLPEALLDKLQQIPQSASSSESPDGSLEDVQRSSFDVQDYLDLHLIGQNGEKWLAHYRVTEALGRGGMGIVYAAQDTLLHRQVALKVMVPQLSVDPNAKNRFLREARAAAGLTSDHIVTVYQVGEDRGLPFIATELLRGQSLESAIREGQKFTVEQITQIASDILQGLSVAHASGIVHRDIKPANLWLEPTTKGTFRVKILDFGLARADLDESQLTHASAIVGTPAFMPPEQARGSKAIDFRSDLFSVGCVLYLLCTEQLPFQGENTIETLIAIAMGTPEPPNSIRPEIPKELSELVMALLEKTPEDRPASASSVLARLAGQNPPSSTQLPQQPLMDSSPSSSSIQATPKPRRARVGLGVPIWTAWVILGLLSVAVASLAIFFWQTPDGRIVKVECNDPGIQIAFGDGDLKIANAYSDPIVVQPGIVELKIKKLSEDGTEFVFETDKLIVRKGDTIALRIELLDRELRLEQIGKGIIDSSVIPDSSWDRPDLTANQRGALWVLSIGGVVVLKDNSTIEIPDQLPTGDYEVTNVRLSTNKLATDDGLKNLSGLTGLKSLNLDSTLITDAGVAHLKDLTQLQELMLFGTKVTDAGLPHLKRMSELTTLGLGGRLEITDAGLVHLLRFKKLKHLYLDWSKITDAGVPLLRRFEELETLNLGGTAITDEGTEPLRYMNTLKELVLYRTAITDKSMVHVGRIKSLEILSFWNTSIGDPGLHQVERLTNLKVLFARNSKITKDGLVRFHAAVPDCKIDHGVEDAPVQATASRYPEQ